ncbi:MAG TPA: hypothetical protein VI009_16545, partial [Xanthobacteraceae bacterium]
SKELKEKQGAGPPESGALVAAKHGDVNPSCQTEGLHGSAPEGARQPLRNTENRHPAPPFYGEKLVACEKMQRL